MGSNPSISIVGSRVPTLAPYGETKHGIWPSDGNGLPPSLKTKGFPVRIRGRLLFNVLSSVCWSLSMTVWTNEPKIFNSLVISVSVDVVKFK